MSLEGYDVSQIIFMKFMKSIVIIALDCLCFKDFQFSSFYIEATLEILLSLVAVSVNLRLCYIEGK